MSSAWKVWIYRSGLFAGAIAMVTAAQIATVSAQGESTDTRRPASIQSGTCDSPGDVVFELNDLLVVRSQGDDTTGDDARDDSGTPGSSADDDDATDDDGATDNDDATDDDGTTDDDGWQSDQGQFVGSEGASVVERSEDTELPTTLDDLLAAPHVVTVYDTEGSDTVIACGEIGGFVFSGDDDDDLAIGLREQAESGFAGVALFDDEDDDSEVDVDVYLARDAA